MDAPMKMVQNGSLLARTLLISCTLAISSRPTSIVNLATINPTSFLTMLCAQCWDELTLSWFVEKDMIKGISLDDKGMLALGTRRDDFGE